MSDTGPPAPDPPAPEPPAPGPVWPPAPRVRPPLGPLPPVTLLEMLGLSLYWFLLIVGVLFAAAMLLAVILVLAGLADLERHWR